MPETTGLHDEIRRVLKTQGEVSQKERERLCQEYNTSRATVRAGISQVSREKLRSPRHTDSGEEYIEREQTKNTISLSGQARIETVDELIDQLQIDTRIWRIEKQKIGYHEGFSTDRDKNPQITPLRRFELVLKRALPLADDSRQQFEELLGELSIKATRHPRVRRPKIKDPHLMVLNLYDVHLGKLAWAMETGEDYDLKIAENRYIQAVEDLLAKNSFNLDRILIPVGQDFLHIDNLNNTTSNGTGMDTDGRMQKIINVAVRAINEAIRRCREVAPVDLVYVPGNHDFTTSWCIVRILEVQYENDREVTVNSSPKCREYYRYGTTLIGMVHGDEIKQDRLPLVMAEEAKEDWSKTTFHEVHTGHLHKKKETHYTTVDTHNGVVVRVLPSLSGTDAWHFKKGFVKGLKAAEALIYNKEHGLTAQLNTFARDAYA